MKLNNKKKLVVILGPTASGKTSLSLSLAKIFPAEIISADSRQIYQEMNIGTSKVLGNFISSSPYNYVEYQGIKHYLIDVCAPDQILTLAQYKDLAINIINDIQSRKKIPFLVGGTGLYISSIVENYQIPLGEPNPVFRQTLENKTLAELLPMLKKLDGETYEIIQRDNKRRVIRAIEVSLSGQKYGNKIKKEPLFDYLLISPYYERADLYQKIDQRVDELLEMGLINEVENLGKKYSWDLPSMSGIGYKQIGLYLQGKVSLEEAIRLLKRDTRRYARRQITWFKRYHDINYVRTVDQADILIKDFLEK